MGDRAHPDHQHITAPTLYFMASRAIYLPLGVPGAYRDVPKAHGFISKGPLPVVNVFNFNYFECRQVCVLYVGVGDQGSELDARRRSHILTA